MNKTILIVGGIIIILGAIVLFSGDTVQAPDQSGSESSVDSVASTVLNTPSPSDEERVVIRGHRIQDGNLTVPVGTTVVFENKDSFVGLPYDAHTVTTGTIDPSGQSGVKGVVPNSGSGVPDGLINESLKKDGTYSYIFDEPGTVTFYIEEHPLVTGQGTVTVTAVEETAVRKAGSAETAVDANEGSAESGVETVESEVVSMNSGSFFFSPSTLTATVGQQVDIDVTSVGLHTFTSDELGVDVRTSHGKTTRVSFTPTRAGTFTYYCAIPGHKEAGQIGTLTVTN